MTKKVELTQVEHKAMLEYKKLLGSNSGDMQFAMYNYINRNYNWSEEIKPLHEMGLEKFVRAWYGYEVEPKFKDGDWVVRDTEFRTPSEQDKYKNYRTNSVFEIVSIHNDYIIDGNGANHDPSNIRHATPEEIKEEKNRRLWKSIGRTPEEIKIGDAIRNIHREIYYVSDELINANDCYVSDVANWLEEGMVLAIYPAESYLSLEVE